MKKHSLFILAAMALGLSANAAPLSPDAALTRALRAPSAPARIKGAASQAQLARTISVDGRPACYVFNTQDAAIVVSADDVAAPVLGYLDEPMGDQMAPGLNYWLNTLAAQMVKGADNGASAWRAPLRVTKTAIPPMTETRWNQDAPFNDKAPTLNGQKTVTGCVATSMSQLLKYHNYPATGSGSESYSWNSETLSFDYANTNFDWDNMLNVYDSDATEVQNNAVATLMYAAGVSVQMDYNVASAGGSGASSVDIPAALIKHFNYGNSTHIEYRSWYSTTDWENLVYENLTYGPVIYDGQSNEGGHSFICDGYDGKGYFHFNWGWGGMSDGYFMLSALDPESQGIGGSASGYNFTQDIIAGIRAQSGGSYAWQMEMPQGFSITAEEPYIGGSLEVSGSVYNLSVAALTGELSLAIVGENGQTMQGSSFSNLASLSGTSSYSVTIPSDLQDGQYTIKPVFTVGENTYDVKVPYNMSQTAVMTVSGGQVSVTVPSVENPSVTNLQAQTPLYIGSYYKISGDITNPADKEYYGPVLFVLADAAIDEGGQLIASSTRTPVSLNPNETKTIEFVGEFENSDELEAGQYVLYACIPSGSEELAPISEGVNVTLQSQNGDPELSVASVTATSGTLDSMDRDKLEFTANVSCTSGYFTGALTLAVFPEKGGESLTTFPSDILFINTGDSQQVQFSGSYSEGEPGKRYMGGIYYGQNAIAEPFYFTLADSESSVIEEIMPEGSKVEYYNMQGQRVLRPSDGSIYIRVARKADGSLTKPVKLVY